MNKGFLPALFAFTFAITTNAGSPDAASTSALADTQTMLQNPAQREKLIDNSQSAQTVDAQVKSLAGNQQNTDEMYKISGQVLEDLVKETGGDPVKMMQIMNQAQTNPDSLMDHLSKESKDSIHSVTTTIENSPTTAARKPAADSK
jgi:hypothetical protein